MARPNDFRGGYAPGPQHNNRRDDGASSQNSQVTAPYGFVPMGPVVEPEWLTHALEKPFLHDVPFKDGLSGAFDLVIQNETPLCVVGSSAGKERLPYKLPDGRFAIPGSSLRGALRNVVEIATFARMHLVNDHRYAVRDLHNQELYLQHMAAIAPNIRKNKNEPMPLVNAAWLTLEDWAFDHIDRGDPDEVVGKLEVSDFAKIEYGILRDIARSNRNDRFDPNPKQSSPQKYKNWGAVPLNVKLPVMFIRKADAKRISEYGVVESAGKSVDGTLVFTGQPQNRNPEQRNNRPGAGQPKHHDFFFFPAKSKVSLHVTRKLLRDFVFAHADRGQQNRTTIAPNEEWGYWKKKWDDNPTQRVPVFFLLDGNIQSSSAKVASMGLAMMYRLPYKHSIHDALRSAGHDPEAPGLDFAEGLFGTVRRVRTTDNQAKTLTIKGRVRIGHAVSGNARPGDTKTVVLGAPKASYYPNYVEQDPSRPGSNPQRGSNGKPLYKTWMDAGARPRGWKRYHAMTKPATPFIPDNVNLENVGTKFTPLAAGAKFEARVDLHNLRPVELGALLWAILLGNAENACHGLGLARPLGYGRCKMSIANLAVTAHDGTQVTAQSALEAFTTYMESKLGNQWANSWQIRELLAIAVPKEPGDVRYQRLDSGARLNEFVKAKTEGQALPSTAGSGFLPAMGAPISHAASGGLRLAPAAPAAMRKADWPKLPAGQTIDVELTELNKKGKWRASATRYEASGVIADGTPPPDAAVGKTYTVEVRQGGDAKNLGLKWKT